MRLLLLRGAHELFASPVYVLQRRKLILSYHSYQHKAMYPILSSIPGYGRM